LKGSALVAGRTVLKEGDGIFEEVETDGVLGYVVTGKGSTNRWDRKTSKTLVVGVFAELTGGSSDIESTVKFVEGLLGCEFEVPR
jgi:hypothetical protein